MKINKMLKNNILITILVFLLCLFMSGCSQSEVPETKLLSYVEQDNPMESRIPMYDSVGEIRYYDLNVDKRLTDKNARSDQVWVNFFVDTDADSADVEACMYFTLYNDGWQLDDIEILSTEFRPLVGPSHDMVTSYLADQYDYFQYQGEEVDLENGFAEFYYKAMNEYTYADYGYDLCVNYYYSGAYWNYSGIELLKETQDWRRIYGTWYAEYITEYLFGGGAKDVDYYTLEINAFDGITLTGAYSIARTFRNFDDKEYIDSGIFYPEYDKWDEGWVLETPTSSLKFLIATDSVVMKYSYRNDVPLLHNILSTDTNFRNEFFNGSTQVETGYRN